MKTRVITIVLMLAGMFYADAQDKWFTSNASGMAMQNTYSVIALRGEYALSVENIPLSAVPNQIRGFYDPEWKVEKRTLYRNKEASRVQWLFLDQRDTIRLVGAFANNGSGFIELYNENGFLIDDRQLESDASYSQVLFTYKEGFLVSALGKSFDGKPEGTPVSLWNDTYRYNRQGGIRAIDRQYENTENSGFRLYIPRTTEIISEQVSFMAPQMVYNTQFLDDIVSTAGSSQFETDKGGKVLSEKRLDSEGKLMGDFINEWDNDRLASITWRTASEERVVKFEYDQNGDRVRESDYKDDTLEREVLYSGNRETEMLYLSGVVVLTTIWEDGKKVSEQRPQSRRVRQSNTSFSTGAR
jgi:hypothetical protein